MSIDIKYEFTFEDKLIPQILKNIYLDQELIDSTIIDIPNEYKNLPLQVLKDFSQFLLENYSTLSNILINNNLNQYKFNELVEPIKFICRTKTGCDEAINQIENPQQNVNPFPPLQEA